MRDPRIEDPTNLWLIHPVSRALLGPALRLRISANAISLTGLAFGVLASIAYLRWTDWRFVVAGFLLCVCWLVADGLDGMVARATGSASLAGRTVDGLCDYGVFGCVYIALAISIGTLEAWLLGFASAAAHAVQSSLYEGERARYHRRVSGQPVPRAASPSKNPLVRTYDAVANSIDRAAAPFDRHMAVAPDGPGLAARYRECAARPMKIQALLTANARIVTIFLMCLAGDPRLFWWYEITLMSLVAIVGIFWHRRVERVLIDRRMGALP